MRFLQKLLSSFFFRLIFAAFLMVFAYYQMDGFSVSYLYTQEKIRPKKPLPPNLAEVFKQPFFYLGSGRQCFAFVSKDKQFVLKFINQAKFSLPYFLQEIPIVYLQEKAQRRKERFYHFYESFQLGAENLSEETAVLYAKLKGEKSSFPMVLVYDPIGYPKTIDLNQTHFILQKKGELIYSYLDSLDSEKFWRAVDSYLEIIVSRIQKGVYDDDLNIDQNIGYFEGRAFLLDFGRLYKAQDLSFEEKEKELKRSTKFFRKWLVKNHPERIPIFEKRVLLKNINLKINK